MASKVVPVTIDDVAASCAPLTDGIPDDAAAERLVAHRGQRQR
jgi:hypothetical protein